MSGLNVLAIDIGGGTQDILLYDENKTTENCFKLVLPSQTVIVAKRIQKATTQGKDICLTGGLMGGGACVSAITEHLQKGYKVFSFSEPAKTIKDNLEVVQKRGIILVDQVPEHAEEIYMTDVDLNSLEQGLNLFNIDLPENIAVAVQDHGESLNLSNRVFRFKHWQEFVHAGGDISTLTYLDPPSYLTRMGAIKKQIPKAILMDTGPAAVRGALLDEQVLKRVETGVTIINIGNQHTIALLVKGSRVYGLFEHHTKFMTTSKLKQLIEALQTGILTNSQVFDDNGHGAIIHEDYQGQNPFGFVAVTGPNRNLIKELDYYMAAPYGDMMISGCFGLVEALKELIV